MVILLVTGKSVRAFGRAWSTFLAVSLLVAVILHMKIAPAEQVMICGSDDMPEPEFYLPIDNRYYLRPFSVAVVMIAWGGTLLRPVVEWEQRPPD